MKQADVINRVANRMLRVETKEIDGQLVTVKYDVNSEHFVGNVCFLIAQDYQFHGKTFKGDPTRMIEKITKIVRDNQR